LHVKEKGFTHAQSTVLSSDFHMGIFDSKKFKCDTCGAKFKTQAELMGHGKMHMTQAPGGMAGAAVQAQDFVCKACGMKFRSQAELMEHSKKMHPM